MGNLIKKDIKNKLKVEQALVDDVCAFCGFLKADPELASQIAIYIIDGEDDNLPCKLEGNVQVADACGYGSSHRSNHDSRSKRLAMLTHKAPEELWKRMAEVLDTIARAGGVASSFPEECPSWMGTLLMETASINSSYYQLEPSAWSALELEKILLAHQLPPDLLVSPLLGAPEQYFGRKFWYIYRQRPDARCYTHSAEYLNRHPGAVRKYLNGLTDAESRISCLELLNKVKFDFSSIADSVAQIACSSSRQARDISLSLLMQCREAAQHHLEQILSSGNASERNEAAIGLWRVAGKQIASVLLRQAEKDSAERVKQTISRLTAPPDEGSATCDELLFALPPVSSELEILPLTDRARSKIVEHFQLLNRTVMANYEQRFNKHASAKKSRQKPDKPSQYTDELIDQCIAFVEGRTEGPPVSWRFEHTVHAEAGVPTGEWLADLKLIHVVRFSFLIGYLYLPSSTKWNRFWWGNMRMLEEYRNSQGRNFGLRELDVVVAGLPTASPGMIADYYLGLDFEYHPYFDWEPEAIWPLFAEHWELLAQSITATPVSTAYYGPTRPNSFAVVSLFPKVPAELTAELWRLALGEAKADCMLAQPILERLPSKCSKIAAALTDGKQSVRMQAADWLGRLGDPAAIEPLREAFKKEKSEIGRGIMLFALDALNADVEDFLSRDALLAEAKAGLAKKFPKGMEWVPLEQLPVIHWEDTGKPLAREIAQWWILQSIQQKLPGCGPILRKFLAMCRKKDTAELAQFTLKSWIAQDTKTCSPEEAARGAQEITDQYWNSTHYRETYKEKDNLYKVIYRNHSTEFITSAIEQKGMLSIVVGAGDVECIKIAEQYIRKYFGTRAAQCKSLIDTLSWIDHPLALQVLLSIANRFRTKSIREAAREHVNVVAERLGWTVDELADRTIPDAGFERPADENNDPVGTEAILELDYGPRQLQVRLNDELEPVITVKGESKTLKALPAPGKNDDEEKAKASKKAFGEAKKLVKDVVKRQTERLYEALLTQRCWSFDDWQCYLAQHPIVGRLCTRLVWTVIEKAADGANKFVTCFRPLEDGSLTDENDEQVIVPEDATIVVAHTCNIPAEREPGWQKHFRDYDVTPLFLQFGRKAFLLPESSGKLTDLEDFLGHCITTFKLRGRATKLGYSRGEAEDGGIFSTYLKSFSSLNMTVVIEFTGSALPEEDVPAALTRMSFHVVRPDQPAWGSTKIALERVPPVLLTECYNNLKQIAAEGTGFDSLWAEKSYF